MLRSRLLLFTGALTATMVLAVAGAPPALGKSGAPAFRTSCWYSSMLCTEIANPQDFWGNWYVGHDEPSVLFYSDRPGSGNQMTYQVTIPKEPAGPYSSDKSFDFELNPAFWFGVAMCDTQSYPETEKSCPPDTDANAIDVRKSTKHPGTAYEELQFYPPGWVKQFTGSSCDPTRWCAALNIDSLSENPITGQTLNASCQGKLLGGIEYVNFAYLTLNGKPQGPPDPLHFDFAKSGNPGPNVLYMNQGDHLTVSLHDSPEGLVTTVADHDTGQTGSMTASAENGFGQIKFEPNGDKCQEIPYTFHPAYSTSQPTTTVPWAAHTYNVAFDDEIGHFDWCTRVGRVTGNCEGLEGHVGDQEPADGDDAGCLDGELALLYKVTGCTNANDPGFDGASYLRDWPDGSANHPTPILFSSPTTVGGARYPQVALEADLPRIEAADLGGKCNRTTGAGCTNPPPTDDGQPAQFYPYYSTTSNGPGGSCMWGIGATLPNTTNDFGGSSAQYGPLYKSYYYELGEGGHTTARYNNFQRVLPNNPC